MGHMISARLSASVSTLLLAAALAAGPAPTAAQADGPTYSRFSAALAFLSTQPLGELRTGPGFGVGVTGAWALDPARRLRIRGELRVSTYGRETRTTCLSATVGCLIQVDIRTDYTSFFAGAGPELAVPVLGTTFVLDATAGYGSFSVSSSVRGLSDPDSEDLLTTTNFDDGFFAWSAGGEVRVPLASQFSVSLGGQYQHNGRASYVREGGISTNPDGSLNVEAMTTDANQLVLTLGVAFHPLSGWLQRLGDDG